MISSKASLVTRLKWVLSDIEKLIEQAKNAFDAYTQDAEALHSEDENKTALQESSDLFEKIQGTLDLIGADGAAMLARETYLLLNALHAGETSKVEEAKQALVNAIIRLPEYLAHLEEGYDDLPVIILPLLNDLRAAREAELLSEHLVFLPDSDAISNDDIGSKEYIPLEADKLQQAGIRLRYHFQKSLLAWYQKEDTEQSMQTIQRVCKNLIRLNKSIRLRSLWWIVIALAEAIEKDKLDSSITVKLLMGRMEREIRSFSELQETAYNQALPDELIKNLLYYVGLAEKGSETLDAVKAAYLLDLHLPQGETLEELREYYNAPGRELWKSVAASISESLSQITHNLEKLNTSEAAQIQLAPIASDMDKLVSTFSVIGLNQAAGILSNITGQISTKADADTHLAEDESLAIAENLIKLQKVLNEYAQTGNDITDEVFSDQIHLDSETISTTQNAIVEDIQEAQEHINLFLESESAYFQLDKATDSLNNAKGALILLRYSDFIPLVDGVIHYLKNDIQQEQRSLSSEEEIHLADAIAVLESSVKAAQQNEDYTDILQSGYEAIQKLGEFSKLDQLVEAEQLDEVKHLLDEKKKEIQKAPSAILKKIKSL